MPTSKSEALSLAVHTHRVSPDRWHLRDWDLRRFRLFEGVIELRETELGYFLHLDRSMQYRRFLIHDNGGEVNIEEIGRTNDHLCGSLLLPVHGTYAQTNEAVVYYRLLRFIRQEPIDWSYSDESMSEEDFRFALAATIKTPQPTQP